jgi:LPXTG-motif cell wall-anchored protein
MPIRGGFSTVYRTINFRLSARRSAVVGAAVALAAGATLALAPVVLAAPDSAPVLAPATTHDAGASTATVLRAGLDVSLLNKTVDVPVNVSLNDVKAPADAKETALTVTVGHGVELGRRVSILRAAVATADATTGHGKAEGYANIADAQVHVPGLPLLALVELDAVSSRATCQIGHRPTASSQLVGVTVLGRHVSLKAIGTTRVDVPGVGRVDLDLTHSVTTSNTAAATALQLKIHVDPLSLGVADVSGDITLAQATCRTPRTGGGSTGGSTSGGSAAGGSAAGGSANGGGTNGGSTIGSTNGGATSGGSTSGSSNGGAASGGSSSGSTSGATSGSTSGNGGASGGSSSSGGSSAGGSSGLSPSGGSGTGPQPIADTAGDLAETGASSSTPYLVIGAGALVAAGAATFLVTSRRRRSTDLDS